MERQGMDHENFKYIGQHVCIFLKLLFVLRFRSTVDRNVNLLRILVLAGDINSYKHVGKTSEDKSNREESRSEIEKILRTWMESLDLA